MRFAARRRPRHGEERLLPLINIVLLLLIVFLVAGRLAGSDPFAVTPPAARSGAVPEVRETVILLAADGRLALDGEVIPQAALGTAIAARLAAGATGTVQLKADGASDTAQVIRILEILRAAGVDRVQLLTRPERP